MPPSCARCCSLLFVVVVIVPIAAEPVRAEEALRRRFLREAPEAWKALQQQLLNFRGGYTEEERVTWPPSMKKAPMTFRTRYDFCLQLSAGCARKEFVKGNQVAIRCINPHYEFAVKAPPDRRSFSLADYERAGLSRPDGERAEPFYCYFNEPYRLNNFSLPEMLARADCELVAVEPVRYRDQPMVRVTFDWTPPEVGKPKWPYWAILDPEAYWTVQSAEVAGSKKKWEIAYARGADGLVYPKRLEQFIESPEFPGYGTRAVVEFDPPEKLGRCDEPPSAFTLTAYGLPEMPEEAGLGRLYAWLIVGSLAGLIGSALLARWVRSQRA